MSVEADIDRIDTIVYEILRDISELKTSIGIIEQKVDGNIEVVNQKFLRNIEIVKQRFSDYAETSKNVFKKIDSSLESLEKNANDLSDIVDKNSKLFDDYVLESKIVKREQRKYITIVVTIVSVIVNAAISVLGWLFGGK